MIKFRFLAIALVLTISYPRDTLAEKNEKALDLVDAALNGGMRISNFTITFVPKTFYPTMLKGLGHFKIKDKPVQKIYMAVRVADLSSSDHVYYMVVGKTDTDWVLSEYLLEKDRRILEHFYFNSKENDKHKTELEIMVILYQRIVEIAQYLMMSYSEHGMPKLKDLVLNGFNASKYKGGLKLRKLGNPDDKVEKVADSEDPVKPAKKGKNKKKMSTKKKKKPEKVGLRKSKPVKNEEKKKPAKNTNKKKPAKKTEKKKSAKISLRKSKRARKTEKKKSAKK